MSSVEAAGHPDLQMEFFFLTHNEETWWLMLLWLNRRHISDAPEDLGSLRNSDIDVEFPLFCCSWLYASAPAPLRLCTPFFYSSALLVCISQSLSFFTYQSFSPLSVCFDCILIKYALKQPQAVVYLSQPTDLYSPRLRGGMTAEPSFTVTSWFTH